VRIRRFFGHDCRPSATAALTVFKSAVNPAFASSGTIGVASDKARRPINTDPPAAANTTSATTNRQPQRNDQIQCDDRQRENQPQPERAEDCGRAKQATTETSPFAFGSQFDLRQRQLIPYQCGQLCRCSGHQL
jgi:hypothetical protein